MIFALQTADFGVRSGMENAELEKILWRVQEDFLRETVARYHAANRDFSSCADMIRASHTLWTDPARSQRIILEYFTARAALREACAMAFCPIARHYHECFETAEECSDIMLRAGRSSSAPECTRLVDEASARMKALGEAEHDLIVKYMDIRV